MLGQKRVGVLIDTVSIQRYIFSTNNLKENVGASHLVKKIYEDFLEEVVKELFADSINIDEWRQNPEIIKILDDSTPFEVGYIGGGNALLFFREEDKAREFIKKWSLKLLIKSPGIIPAFAVGEIDFGNFSNSLQNLFKTLLKNKTEFLPEVIIKRHGITAECPNTGYSAEVWCDQEGEFISSVSYAKINAAKDALNELINKDEIKRLLKDSYTFTFKIDKLGQRENEDSHIAIVHIDGNDMGDRIRRIDNLVDLRKFSKSLKEATEKAFNEILKKIIERIENGDLEKVGIYLQREEDGHRTILPLRPIIIGGDDITFVSEGRLGIWLAKIFLEEFQRQEVSDGKGLTACAGVAITKTKYPFYRGYILSEELTKSAKEARKSRNNSGSWIDFHIAYGGFSEGIKEIRESQFRTSDGKSVIMRPYRIEDFDKLLEGVAHFKNTFPRSKVMELRQVIYSSEVDRTLFMERLKVRGLKLPEYNPSYWEKEQKKENENLFIKQAETQTETTPYFDMIELMDFYPEFAIESKSKGGKDDQL